MELAVKFSNEYINVAEQTVKKNGIAVKKYVRAAMPEGAFQDGIVVNTNLVADALKKLLKEHKIATKKTLLCISGSVDIIQKEIRIPKSAKRHVREMLKNELIKSAALRNNYLFDYIAGSDKEEDGMNTYNVYMLPTELVRNYQQTMKRAGLTLERIEPVSHSMEKLGTLLKMEESEKRTILVDAEKTGMDIMMTGMGIPNLYRHIEIKEETIEENVFIVSAIPNINNNDDPIGRAIDKLTESISRLMQFQSQNSRGVGEVRIKVYGELAEHEEFLESMERRTGIPTSAFKPADTKVQIEEKKRNEFSMSYGLVGMTCGRLVGEKKALSFIQLQGEEDTMSMKDYLPLLAGLFCVVVLAGSYTVMAWQNGTAEKKNERMETEIESIEASEEYQRRLSVRDELMKLNDYNENCQNCIQTLEGTERFDADIFRKTDKLVPEGITIEGHEFEGNLVRFRCSADTQEGPAAFAKTVTDAGIFEEVSYNGFSAYENVDHVIFYSFILECSN